MNALIFWMNAGQLPVCFAPALVMKHLLWVDKIRVPALKACKRIDDLIGKKQLLYMWGKINVT